MGRTATAFLVLIAVGGCVADDQGPAAAMLAGQQTQSVAVAPGTYAAWNRSGDFAALQGDPGAPPPSQAMPPMQSMPAMPPMQAIQPMPAMQTIPAAPPAARMNATLAMKPTSMHRPVSLPPLDQAAPLPAPAPAAAPAELMVDQQLVQATMVQTPPDRPEPAAREAAVVYHPNGDHIAPTVHDAPTVIRAPSDRTEPAAHDAPVVLHPIADQVEPPAHDGPPVSHTNPANVDADPAPAATPAAPGVRVVNSKRITVNYEVKDAGASGTPTIELWCTQDAHAWKKGEIVAQTNHSFTVEVKDEGLYGFTLLARNGAAASKDAPQSGEQPQTWVLVDCTKPVVQISGVELSRAGAAPGVHIHWTAKDKNLGPKPITVSYAEQPEGPWTPVASGVENSGQYEWQPTTTAPPHVFFRVEALDLGGNIGASQTANPLRIDPGVAVIAPPPAVNGHAAPAPPVPEAARPPSAAILGVEPNGN